MSLVGPRPVIFKEEMLIRARTRNGANQIRPGITGWAQVKGRDLVGPARKARLDGEYRRRRSLAFDMYCILLTASTVIAMRGHAEGHSNQHHMIDEELETVA